MSAMGTEELISTLDGSTIATPLWSAQLSGMPNGNCKARPLERPRLIFSGFLASPKCWSTSGIKAWPP
eukprot:6618072-Heterocapsa_arctica.AAC.1